MKIKYLFPSHVLLLTSLNIYLGIQWFRVPYKTPLWNEMAAVNNIQYVDRKSDTLKRGISRATIQYNAKQHKGEDKTGNNTSASGAMVTRHPPCSSRISVL